MSVNDFLSFTQSLDVMRYLTTFSHSEINRPFYRYGGHVELIGFKEYYGMPRGHEDDPVYLNQYLRALFGPIFLFS